jgi:hypothetical protein
MSWVNQPIIVYCLDYALFFVPGITTISALLRIAMRVAIQVREKTPTKSRQKAERMEGIHH